MEDGRFELDIGVVRRRFAHAAARYDEVALLQREVGQRMAARLDYVKINPRRILDIGCGTGRDLEALGARYPGAERVGCDFALPMLQVARGCVPWFKRALPWLAARQTCWVCGDVLRLPVCSNSIGLVWSNLMLEWVSDPLLAISEMRRVLEVGGLLMFSTLGPDTLSEMRAAFAAVDDSPHVHRFIDMHDIGDMLVAAGFAEPVVDMEVIRLTYAALDDLLLDLRANGATNAITSGTRKPISRTRLPRLKATYEAQRREGRLPATFEIVYGHAWKPRSRTTKDGRTLVSLDTLRART